MTCTACGVSITDEEIESGIVGHVCGHQPAIAPDEPSVLNTELIAQCHSELADLAKAWADRGISPFESAQILVANGFAMLCYFRVRKSAIVEQLDDHWLKNGGLP